MRKPTPFTIEYHWQEFCSRLFYILFSTLITFIFCFSFSSQLLYLFVRPFLIASSLMKVNSSRGVITTGGVQRDTTNEVANSALCVAKTLASTDAADYYSPANSDFIFTELTEAFSITLSVCSQITLVSIFCNLLYQFSCFLFPSFYLFERKRSLFFLLAFCAIFFSIFCVIYFVFLPPFCKFLLNFSIQSTSFTLELQAKIESYIKLLSKIFLIFLVIGFILFLFYFWFSYLALHYTQFFAEVCGQRQKFLLLWFIVAALLSPPDPWSQCVLAFFFSLFFEFLVWLSLFHVELKSCRSSNNALR